MAHDHDHDHHHHEHHHDGINPHQLEQLFNIGSAAALGAVAVLVWWQGTLSIILHPKFFIPVLVGGMTLIVLSAIRAAALWREAGKAVDCCSTHGHDHEHGWNPARYSVLMLPVVLYLLNLPNQSFSAEWLAKNLQTGQLEDGGPVAAKSGMVLGFKELSNAAHLPQMREFFQGQTGKLSGRYQRLSDKEFTLFKLNMTCCAADVVPVEVRIISPEPLPNYGNNWVEAEGQIQFRKLANRDKYIPVLILESKDKVRPTEKGSDVDTL